MDFEQQFSQWIDESLAAEVPENVKAFAFLLWEPAEIKGSKFAVDLVGTALRRGGSARGLGVR